MPSASNATPRVIELADRLVADIEARGLSAGDRYFTTAEASKMLGVGNGAANRALQILERRNVIVRQQRRGAFVANPRGPKSAKLDRVHFLVHRKYLRAEGIGQDETLLGIEHQLPAVPVQISFLPAHGETAHVEELLAESAKAERTDGFVLVRASYETQRLVASHAAPSVVFGTIYPAVENLVSLSADMTAVGSLLARHLIDRGFGRLAYLNRQVVFHGDQLTMNGITAAIEESGGVDRLTLRFLPDARDAYASVADSLLRDPEGPQGFICRTAPMADEVRAAAEKLGLRLGTDLEITVCDYYLKPGQEPRYAWARPQISPEEQGRHLAKLLIAQATLAEGRPTNEVIRVAIEYPNAAANGMAHDHEYGPQ